jgi:hypothetical protein
MALSIRFWAAIATALATAASVDCSSELLANAGWLGGFAASDGHQEAVFPTALVAALILVGLALTVALRASSGERARYHDSPLGPRILVAAATLVATFAVVVLMEAYEMRFGGLSAFDPRSVFVQHWAAVSIGYVLVATLVSRLVAFSLRAAVAAGKLAAHVLVRFLGADRSAPAAVACGFDAFGTRIVHRPLVVALGALALRAPPASQLLRQPQLLT